MADTPDPEVRASGGNLHKKTFQAQMRLMPIELGSCMASCALCGLHKAVQDQQQMPMQLARAWQPTMPEQSWQSLCVAGFIRKLCRPASSSLEAYLETD